MLPAKELLQGDPFLAYAYSYPHKTAYRPLPERIPLSSLWEKEDKGALSLYLHVPFCEMRCGFCNLFTQARPKEGIGAAYLKTLQRQAAQVKAALKEAKFSRFAIGGGTPTQLEIKELEALFTIAQKIFSVDLAKTPCSVETSPETASLEKIQLLAQQKVSRVSIGVQSFIEEETKALQRPQKKSEVYQALERLKSQNFPTLNIDLIYGVPGQTLHSWLASLQEALRFRPEELYLYPLYIRPFTGLSRVQKSHPEDLRLSLYRAGRDFLRSQGFTQVSMRMFQAPYASKGDTPRYTCQEDGMIGLGCGARSYTKGLHYSEEYAVGKDGVREIIEAYLSRPDDWFDSAWYGFPLTEEEQKRRFVILSLLHEGVSFEDYGARFGAGLFDDFSCLRELVEVGLATQTEAALTLTSSGVERSDMLGVWLFSEAVQERMKSYSLR